MQSSVRVSLGVCWSLNMAGCQPVKQLCLRMGLLALSHKCTHTMDSHAHTTLSSCHNASTHVTPPLHPNQTLLKVATAVAQGAASSAASSAADANAAASIAEAMAADAWQFFNNVDDSSVLRDSSSASVGSSLTKGAISIPAPPATAPYNCLKMSCSSSIGELRPSLRTTVQDRAIGKQELGPRPLSALSATPKPVVPARPSPDVATQGGVLKNPGSKQRSWQEVMFEKMEGVLRGAVEAVRKVPKYFKEKRSAYQLQEWERQCAKSAAPT